ncbi:MAG: nicotinate (nicotinamide) nucleotide adenylyltransferase [Desulfobacterales bacterium]|nr:nicotinate (nicotinamide) nucleotide adenylyltransferase [Desulfobacterales bacterium]
MKIGILGGTFDPIHMGHLRTAEEIGEALNLEKVYLIPSALPPHKTKEPPGIFAHRLAMVRLAAAGSPILEASDLEGKRPGFSYSIETLKEFYAICGPELELFFILGTDAFLEIKTWKEYSSLFDYANFVIINRAGYKSEKLEKLLSDPELGLKSTHKPDSFFTPSGKTLIFMAPTLMDISSTRVREMVSKGKSIRFLVPQSVMEYATQKGLYK